MIPLPQTRALLLGQEIPEKNEVKDAYPFNKHFKEFSEAAQVKNL